MTVIQMSVSAGVLIAATIIVRRIFSHQLPQKTFLVLWGVAVCRLLMPISIPSKLSVFSLVKQSTVTQLAHKNTTAGQQLFTEIAGNISTQSTEKISVIAIIWIFGILLLATYFVLTHIRCRRIYKMALPIENKSVDAWKQTNPTKRSILIKQCDQISSPLTYGLLRPVILLPKTLNLDDTNILRYVLAHEYTHIKQFDLAKKYLLVLCLCVHWFNPLVWFMCLLANRDIEISCDQTVVRSLGNEMRSDYAKALICMEESRCIQMPLCNNFSKSEIKERIMAIMKMKKVSIVAIIGAVTLVVGTSVVFATSAEEDIAKATNIPNSLTSELIFVEEQNPTLNKGNGYDFQQLKNWFDSYKIEATQLVNNGIWTQEFSDTMTSRYTEKISKIEKDGGVVFGMTSEDSNETINVLYDINHLLFQVPEDMSALDINAPKWILKVFPLE